LGDKLKPLYFVEVLDPRKKSFRPSNWTQNFRNQKTSKNIKLPEDCFEPVGIGRWQEISTWINPPSLVRNGIHCVEVLRERENHLLNLHLDELLALLEKLRSIDR
jgi:hypothetical protein